MSVNHPTMRQADNETNMNHWNSIRYNIMNNCKEMYCHIIKVGILYPYSLVDGCL